MYLYTGFFSLANVFFTHFLASLSLECRDLLIFSQFFFNCKYCTLFGNAPLVVQEVV